MNVGSCLINNVKKGGIPRPPKRAYALGGGVPLGLGGRQSPRRPMVAAEVRMGGAGGGGWGRCAVEEACGGRGRGGRDVAQRWRR